MSGQMKRREFIRNSAVAAGCVAAGLGGNFVATAADEDAIKKTRSYSSDMEYRLLGNTGLWVSSVCLGGHWKRVGEVTGQKIPGVNKPGPGPALDALRKNRDEVMSRCIDVGINYVDACTKAEVSVYGPALIGRRDKMYMGFAMWPECPRNAKYRTAKVLLETLEQGMKSAEVDYVDVWRLVASTPGKHSVAEEEEFAKAFEIAKKQGKARFTGVSSHGRPWLKHLAETNPEQFQVLLFPYTASSKVLPKDSLFDAVREHNIGTFGIKPFGGLSLFNGTKDAEDKARRARLAIRNILANPAVTAPIPGLASVAEVDNMVQAVKEKRELAAVERRELEEASRQMWASLPEHYEWLRDWEYV